MKVVFMRMLYIDIENLERNFLNEVKIIYIINKTVNHLIIWVYMLMNYKISKSLVVHGILLINISEISWEMNLNSIMEQDGKQI